MKSLAVFVIAVILAPAAPAQHQTFAVNPDASEVNDREGYPSPRKSYRKPQFVDRVVDRISGSELAALRQLRRSNPARQELQNSAAR